jgi:hypothetical protein
VTQGRVGCSGGDFLAQERGSRHCSISFYGTTNGVSWGKEWVGAGHAVTKRRRRVGGGLAWDGPVATWRVGDGHGAVSAAHGSGGAGQMSAAVRRVRGIGGSSAWADLVTAAGPPWASRPGVARDEQCYFTLIQINSI